MGANRFQLSIAPRVGFRPRVVIDGGAHLGLFSLAAKQIFPSATFHLVEPQPACSAHLKMLCSREGFILHECALAEYAGTIGFSQTSQPNTGAHIKLDGDIGAAVVSALTLDALFESRVTLHDRVLLKNGPAGLRTPRFTRGIKTFALCRSNIDGSIVFWAGV